MRDRIDLYDEGRRSIAARLAKVSDAHSAWSARSRAPPAAGGEGQRSGWRPLALGDRVSSKLPSPPDPFTVAHNIEIWDADKPVIRVHHSAFGATEFNPGKGNGRFHPLVSRTRVSIPTIYGSNTRDDLEVIAPPRSLFPPSSGWHEVLAAAEAAGITVTM
jgi:hypothetical protein